MTVPPANIRRQNVSPYVDDPQANAQEILERINVLEKDPKTKPSSPFTTTDAELRFLKRGHQSAITRKPLGW